MLAINRDILEEIVPHYNIWKLNEDESVEQIKNFMLSGKEPYEATLRFFSHADTIVIAPNAVRIIVKRHTLRVSDGNNLYKFPYTFCFLNDILGALKNSCTKLEIEYYPVSAAGRKVLAHLTQKTLKFVSFEDTDDLPSDYYEFFKNECSFDDLHLDLCCVKNPTLSEFFKLTSKHRSITTHFEYFSQKMSKYGFPFPAVESLSFYPCFCEEDFEDFPFIFTFKAVKTFSTLLVESMPNLNNLVADFSANPEQQMFTWKKVYKEMKKFNPEMFKHIPTKVKGSFNFYVVERRTSLKEIIEILPEDNHGIEFDHAEKRLVKKFDIHDGLTFEFVLQVSEEEESEEEFEDESEGGSDEEILFHNLLNAWQGDLLYALQGALHGHVFEGDENDDFDDAANANDEV